jgi:hypothetical protein
MGRAMRPGITSGSSRTDKVSVPLSDTPNDETTRSHHAPRALGGSGALGARDGAPRLKTFAAVHGTTLSGLERNRCFFTALRADGFGFDALNAVGSRTGAARRAIGLARFAPLGLVLETLVGEEHLLAGGENELRPAFGTLQDLIVVFHALLRDPCWDRTGSVTTGAGRRGESAET